MRSEERTRRALLAATAGTGAIVLAGCTRNGGSSDNSPESVGNTSDTDETNESETPSDNSDGTDENETDDENSGMTGTPAVDEELEEAVEFLNANDEVLNEYLRQVMVFAETDGTLDPHQPLGDIEDNYATATDHLDNASTEATGDEQDVIDAYRTVADVQYEVARYFEHLDEFFDCNEQLEVYIYEEDSEGAHDHYESCISIIDDSDEQFDAVGEAFDEEKLSQATEFETLNSEFDVNDLGEVQEEMDATRTILELLGHYLDGIVTFETGEEYYSEEEWSEAADYYANARGQFLDAEEEMGGMIMNPDLPFDYEEQVNDLRCLAEQHAVAMVHYEEAAELMADDHEGQAQDERTLAMSAIQECYEEDH